MHITIRWKLGFHLIDNIIYLNDTMDGLFSKSYLFDENFLLPLIQFQNNCW